MGAVILGLFAHEKGVHRQAVFEAQRRDVGDHRHGTHLQPADIIDLLAADFVQQRARAKISPLGVHHRRLEIEVEFTLGAARELEFAAPVRALLDDVDQILHDKAPNQNRPNIPITPVAGNP